MKIPRTKLIKNVKGPILAGFSLRFIQTAKEKKEIVENMFQIKHFKKVKLDFLVHWFNSL